jgi:hypothetical protein
MLNYRISIKISYKINKNYQLKEKKYKANKKKIKKKI